MFKKMKLNGKILGSIALTLLLTSAVSFWITQRRVNQQAEEAFRDKVRQITGMAGATRVWFSDNIDTLVPGKNFKTLNQVPVVVAWSVARQYATSQNMEFHTPSLTPRNPKNQADDFERHALEAFQKDSALKEFSERRVEERKGCDALRPGYPAHRRLPVVPRGSSRGEGSIRLHEGRHEGGRPARSLCGKSVDGRAGPNRPFQFDCTLSHQLSHAVGRCRRHVRPSAKTGHEAAVVCGRSGEQDCRQRPGDGGFAGRKRRRNWGAQRRH